MNDYDYVIETLNKSIYFSARINKRKTKIFNLLLKYDNSTFYKNTPKKPT
jgi:hypothetical protein